MGKIKNKVIRSNQTEIPRSHSTNHPELSPKSRSKQKLSVPKAVATTLFKPIVSNAKILSNKTKSFRGGKCGMHQNKYCRPCGKFLIGTCRRHCVPNCLSK